MGKQWYQPIPHARGFVQTGTASWYGKDFHGRLTSNKETYDMHALTAAHKTLPFNTLVRVRNIANGKWVDVRINDRGPFVRNRIIDLSFSAAKQLDMVGPGTARVEITAMGMAKGPNGSAGSNTAPIDYYSGNFTIQVGAFMEPKNAEALRAELDRQFRNAHVVAFKTDKGTFYRVRVGRCSRLDQAVEYEKIMLDRGYGQAFIVAE